MMYTLPEDNIFIGTQKWLAKTMHISESTMNRSMKQLYKKGLVEKVKGGYKVNLPGESNEV